MSNYATLAISVPDFLEELKPGITFPLSYQGTYLKLDDKFSGFYKIYRPESLPSMGEVADFSEIAESGFLEKSNSRGPDRVSASFSAAIIRAAGITDPVFFQDFSFFPNLMKDLVFFPCKSVPFVCNGSPVKETFCCLPSGVLASLAQGLGALNKLTILEADYDSFPLSVACLRSGVEGLLRGHSQTESGDSYEYWIQVLVNQYLQSRDCWRDVEVISSRWSDDWADLGGLKKDVPYISLGGLQEYNEDGWSDPRETNPDMVDEVSTILLGKKSKKKFGKFTPESNV